MTTLQTAYTQAASYWQSKGPSSRMMPIRALACIHRAKLTLATPLAGLTPSTGTLILTSLRGLSKGSQASYYAAFRRMLTLAGVSTANWPSGATPSRSVREPLSVPDLERLEQYFADKGWHETSALSRLLKDTGMRIDVEALSVGAVSVVGEDLKVIGKGGHERLVPCANPHEMFKLHEQARRLCYGSHYWRWKAGVRALGICSKLPTPHAARHQFATEAYRRCRDLHVVRDLLGHADINTTARYIGVDKLAKRKALGL